MSKPNEKPDSAFSPNDLAIVGQQIMLDALRAEFGALQAVMPGLARAGTTANSATTSDESLDAMFDNMPV